MAEPESPSTKRARTRHKRAKKRNRLAGEGTRQFPDNTASAEVWRPTCAVCSIGSGAARSVPIAQRHAGGLSRWPGSCVGGQFRALEPKRERGTMADPNPVVALQAEATLATRFGAFKIAVFNVEG